MGNNSPHSQVSNPQPFLNDANFEFQLLNMNFKRIGIFGFGGLTLDFGNQQSNQRRYVNCGGLDPFRPVGRQRNRRHIMVVFVCRTSVEASSVIIERNPIERVRVQPKTKL